MEIITSGEIIMDFRVQVLLQVQLIKQYGMIDLIIVDIMVRCLLKSMLTGHLIIGMMEDCIITFGDDEMMPVATDMGTL